MSAMTTTSTDPTITRDGYLAAHGEPDPARRAAAPARRSLLRAALALDAAVSGANGLAYLVAAGPLGDLLGLAPDLLRAVGAGLVAFALVVAAAARREDPPRTLVRAIVAGNVAWVAGSLAVVLAGWGSPSTAGSVWIVLQAVVVGAFAELQLTGLRRAGAR
jgi:hypothetical protein